MITQWLLARMPEWARLSHPVTRYIMRRATYFMRQRWVRIINCMTGMLFLGGVLVFSIMLYLRGEYDNAFLPGEPPGFVIMYPLLAFFHFALSLGAVVSVMALGLTIPGTSLDDRRDTWEVAKISPRGADLVTRGRWVVALYRMASVLVLLTGARIVFVGWMVVDFARDPGQLQAALDHLTPALPMPVALLLLGVLWAAVTILPLTWAMLLVSLGLFVSTWIRYQWVQQVVQQVIFFSGFVLYGIALTVGWYAFVTPERWASDPQWRVVGVWAMALFGDQGLRLTTRPAILNLLAHVDYGIFAGVVLLAIAYTQVYWARGLLRWSVRRAERATRQ